MSVLFANLLFAHFLADFPLQWDRMVEVMKPWLPSLESKIVFKGDNRRRDKADLTVHFGVVDVPEEQSQSDYSIDLEKQGNVVYIQGT